MNNQITSPWDKILQNIGLPVPDSASNNPIADVLVRFLDWLLVIFGLLAVIAFIVSGFFYLTSQGDTYRIEKSKKALVYGIVGIVVGLSGLIAIKTIDSLLRG